MIIEKNKIDLYLKIPKIHIESNKAHINNKNQVLWNQFKLYN